MVGIRCIPVEMIGIRYIPLEKGWDKMYPFGNGWDHVHPFGNGWDQVYPYGKGGDMVYPLHCKWWVCPVAQTISVSRTKKIKIFEAVAFNQRSRPWLFLWSLSII